MTSLQQQLASIRAHSTQELNLKAQKVAHSKSLIFEPQAAASQSFFDIYQICVQGFKQLCTLDARFTPFAGNLFSEQSMDIERTSMSREANGKLNKSLESFLGLVGPRLQLRDAQCAVEWLVRRFRVHEYNTQFLILTFLSYHDTNMFAVMLQLIPDAKLPPVFGFMRSYISSRTNFKRPIFIREASRRPALLNAISQYVLNVSREGQQLENLAAFWVDVSIQSLNALLDKARSGRQNVQKDQQDEVVLQITSVIHDGLQLRNVPELVLACYALVTVVASKAVLDDQLLDSLMVSVVNTWDIQEPEACLTCLAVLAEARSAKRNRLPKSVIIKLTHNLAGLAERLSVADAKTSVSRLAYGLALPMLDARPDDYEFEGLGFVAEIIARGLLTKSRTKALMSRSLQATTNPNFDEASERGNVLVAILQSWARDSAYRPTFQKALDATGLMRTNLPAVISLEVIDDNKTDDTALDTMALDRTQSIHDALSELDNLTVTDSTFFATDRPPSFDALGKALASLHSHHKDQADLQTQRPFGQLSQQALVSFLVRTSCSLSSPLTARLAALNAIGTLLPLHNGGNVDLDPTICVPFLVCALGDPELRVRRLAADILAVARTLFVDTQISPAGSQQPLGLDLSLPAVSDVQAFVKALVPHLQSCVLDSSKITLVVGRLLAGHAHDLQSPAGRESKELKSSVRLAMATFFARCAAECQLLCVQLRLFPMLSSHSKSASSIHVKYVYPVVRQWVQLDAATAQTYATAEDLSVRSINEHLLALLHAKDPHSADLFLQLAEGKAGPHRKDLEEPAYSTIQRLYRKTEAPEAMVQGLMNIALANDNTSTPSSCRAAARDAFVAVNASTSTLATLLALLSDGVADRPSPAKRRRVSKTGAGRPSLDSLGLDRELSKQTLILEKIEQSKSKSPELLGGLFHALTELMHLESATQTKQDYLLQLVIRTMNAIVDQLIAEDASQESKKYQSSIRMDILVECLRNDSARGSQNDILLLVSKLATWDPELVLHSVMPIFTFMGKNTIRQGDEYTAHVIARTIETIIPPLSTSLRKNNKSVVTALSEVLQSFAAAYEHIPSHRRLPLFELLATKLGAAESLFGVVAMLVDRRPTDTSITTFLADLMAGFGAETELVTFKRCFDLLLDVHAPNAFASRRTFSETVLNTKEKSSEQIEASVTNILVALSVLLRRTDFRRRVAKLFKSGQSATSDINTSASIVYSQLLSQSIRLNQVLSKKRAKAQLEARQSLSDVMKVLPVAHMLPSIQGILDSSSDDVKLVAMRALEDQVRAAHQGDSDAVDALLEFVAHLCEALKSTQEIELKQVSMRCIDQIAERFGRRDTNAISSAAHVLAGEAALGHLDISLQILALLTLASMIDVLREEFVPLIPRILQQAFPILEMSAGQERYGELRSALFAVVNAIIECLPEMLSDGDLDKALKMCHRSAAGIPVKDEASARQQLYSLAVRHLGAETCFAAAQRNLSHAVETGPEACADHLNFALSLVQRHTKRAIREQATTIFRMVTEGWSVRRLCASNSVFEKLYNSDTVEAVQTVANNIAMAAISKLNDDTLRPHFVSLVDWATDAQATKSAGDRVCSAISLFQFLKVLNDRFKSLVTSYASYYLMLSAKMLVAYPSSAAVHITLLQAIMEALASNFASDESDFWQDPQHFGKIAPHLVEQIECFAQADTASLATHVFPTMRQLVSAGYSPDKRTTVNTEVLKLLRHDDPRVRLAAVQCQREMLAQVGDEWVTMVSQMLPFINEAQEDGDKDVERETRRWIKDLEAGLGESMAGMLQ